MFQKSANVRIRVRQMLHFCGPIVRRMSVGLNCDTYPIGPNQPFILCKTTEGIALKQCNETMDELILPLLILL